MSCVRHFTEVAAQPQQAPETSGNSCRVPINKILVVASVPGDWDRQKVFRTAIQALEETLAILDIERSKGESVIALTNYGSWPLADLSDVVLCSTALGSPITSENAAARIVQLNIMGAIFMAVA